MVGRRLGGVARVAALAYAAVAILPAIALAQVEPYGADDAGGFRNVLPPGSKGTDNAVELAAFQTAGSYPEHWNDQQPLYENLIYGSPDPTDQQLPEFFKDATFGVREGEVESTTTPRPGVTILRDEGYGVPHIYGETRADTMFGIGYASAQDRLFLMDVLRHTGRAQLSSFVGGSDGNRRMDRQQWQLAPYTEEDLAAQIDPQRYGPEGQQVFDDAQAYIDGINAYIQDAMTNPALMPAEYAAIGKVPEPWELTDIVAEASLIGGIFSVGGGGEVDSATLLREFQERFGRRAGRRAWLDFRRRNDPEAPTTVSERFRYPTGKVFASRGRAIPRPRTVEVEQVGPPLEEGGEEPAAAEVGSIGGQLLRMARSGGHASNWLLLPGRESATGRPIAVMGPQVGYFVPQILMEQDVHGPGIDVRGAAFPGTNLYVQLGHGRDYAWSATTAISDHIDVFAEVLCQDDFHYRYKGECVPMEKLERTNSWIPNALDDTPPGSETLTAYRTVHGVVFSRGRVRGKEVAFVRARPTYLHEIDSAIGFLRLNDPQFMDGGAQSFRRAVERINFSFNWAYVDEEQIAYQLSGWYPRRAPGTSPEFPVLGTGRYDWRGWDPGPATANWLPQDELPHAVDPRMLLSWNNKQAPGWAASDDNYAYGPLQRVQLLERFVRRGIRGGGKMSLAELVQAMEEPATQDLRAVKLLPLLLRALGEPRSQKLRGAIETLRDWQRAGGHRRDLDQDGTYESNEAVMLMDAWWPLLVRTQFRGALGKDLYEEVQETLAVGDHTREQPAAPSYFSGWWGYVSKDLRDVFGKRPPGAFSRAYCGGGSKSRCRAALRRSLKRALDVTAEQLYARGPCDDNPQPSCWDKNRSTIASGIDIPPAPFQNRPTFQQTVALERGVGG
jgi:acyl-homoserine lactone acylase PvdQ